MIKLPFLQFFSSFFSSSKLTLYAVVIVIIAGLFISLKFSQGKLERQKLETQVIVAKKDAVIANDVFEAKKLTEVAKNNEKSSIIVSKTTIKKEKSLLNTIKKSNEVKDTIEVINHKIIVDNNKQQLSESSINILLTLSNDLDSKITNL